MLYLQNGYEIGTALPAFYVGVKKDQITVCHLKILKSFQYKSGLFAASKPTENTGYNKSWLRDNFYETIAFEIMGAYKVVGVTYRAILNKDLKNYKKSKDE